MHARPQVRETRASLRRMLEDFVRDAVPSEPEEQFHAKVQAAREGSFEVVTSVLEAQVTGRGASWPGASWERHGPPGA